MNEVEEALTPKEPKEIPRIIPVLPDETLQTKIYSEFLKKYSLSTPQEVTL